MCRKEIEFRCIITFWPHSAAFATERGREVSRMPSTETTSSPDFNIWALAGLP